MASRVAVIFERGLPGQCAPVCNLIMLEDQGTFQQPAASRSCTILPADSTSYHLEYQSQLHARASTAQKLYV